MLVLSLILIYGTIASFYDIKERRIPNVLSLSMFLVFSIIAYTKSDPISVLWNFLWAFLIGYLLYMFHFWNAGDGKVLIVLSMATMNQSTPVPTIPTSAFLTMTAFSSALLLFLPVLLWDGIKTNSWGERVLKREEVTLLLKRILFVFSSTWIVRIFVHSPWSLKNPLWYLLGYEAFSLLRSKVMSYLKGPSFYLTVSTLLFLLVKNSAALNISLKSYAILTVFYTALYFFVEKLSKVSQRNYRIPFSPFLVLASILLYTGAVRFFVRLFRYV